jgi:hypothetical protein
MAVLIYSGRFGQAEITAASSGSFSGFGAAGAPLFAHPPAEIGVFTPSER